MDWTLDSTEGFVWELNDWKPLHKTRPSIYGLCPGWKLESLCPGAYAVSVCTLLDVQNASRFRSTARRLQGPARGWEDG